MRRLLVVAAVALQAIAADDSLEHSDAFTQCAADPASCTSLKLRNQSPKLTGSLPSELGLLTALTELDVKGNDLTGSVPSELSLLDALEKLSLSFNKLSGSLPQQLQSLTNLKEMEVACNTNLCGCYPPGLAGDSTDNYGALFSTQLGSRCGGAPLPPDPVCDASAGDPGAVEVEAEAAAAALADVRALSVDMNATWSCALPDAAAAQDQAIGGDGPAGGAGKSLVWLQSVDKHTQSGVKAQSVWTHSADECANQEDGVYVVKDAAGGDRAEAEAACEDWAEGGALAQFTPTEFACQQSVVAEAVMQQVGVEAPVFTGVRSDDGSCLVVTVLSGTDYSGLDEQAHAEWKTIDCDAAADIPTLCRQGNPTRGNSTFEAGVFKVQAAQVFGKVKAQDVFDNLPSMGDEDGEYLDVGGSSKPKYELMLDSDAAEPEQDAKLAAQQSVKSQGLFDELPVSMPNIPSSEELIADHTPSSEGSQGSLIPALPEVHIKSVDDNDGGGGGEVNTQQSVKTQDTLDNLPDLDGYGEYMDVGGSSKPKYELMLDSDAAVPDQDKELDQQSVKTQDTFDNLPDLDGYGEYLEIGGSSKPKYELMLDSDAAVPDQDKELDQQSVNTQGMEGLRDMVQKYIHINDTGSDVEEEDNAELQEQSVDNEGGDGDGAEMKAQGMEGLRDMVQKYIHINDTASSSDEDDEKDMSTAGAAASDSDDVSTASVSAMDYPIEGEDENPDGVTGTTSAIEHKQIFGLLGGMNAESVHAEDAVDPTGETARRPVAGMDASPEGLAASGTDCVAHEPGVFAVQAASTLEDRVAAAEASTCAAMHNHDDGRWGAAQFTTEEFACQQEAVAESILGSVGVNQPVITGVKSQSDSCMAAEVTSSAVNSASSLPQTRVQWTEVDCEHSQLPTLCRQANPEHGGSTFQEATYRVQAQATAGSLPGLFVAACVACAVSAIALAAQRQRMLARGVSLPVRDLEKQPLVKLSSAAAEYSAVGDSAPAKAESFVYQV